MVKTIQLLLLLIVISPALTLANGGDQRVVENTYLINLARSPFTPRVGAETAMLISFADLQKNQLIGETLVAKIRIAKLEGIGSAERELLFEKGDIKVEGGILEFPYTFQDTGLHEIFIDFALESNPKKIYESPDFLLDVQGREPQVGRSRFVIGFVLSGLAGIALGFILGFLLGRKPSSWL